MGTSTLLFLTAINLLNYFDRYLLAALLPSVQRELELSHTAGGVLLSAFVLGYFIFSPVFGYLGDRVSRPLLMALGVALWSLATAGTAGVATFAALLFTRVLVGVGEASFATIAPGFIKDRVRSPEQLNRALSIFFTAIPVGAALAYALSGALISYIPWRTIFLVAGLPGLVMALFLLRLRERRVQSHEETGALVAGFRRILAEPNLRFAIGGYALQAFALNGIAAWITTLGELRGFGYENTNMVFGIILVLTGLVGTLVGGKISTHYLERSSNKIRTLFLFTAYSAMLGVPFLAACFAVSNATLFFVCCAIAELVIFAGTAPLNALIVLSAPPGLVTLTQGLTIATINLVGALLAPLLIGALADLLSLPLGLQLTTVSLTGAIALWWWGGGRHQAITKTT